MAVDAVIAAGAVLAAGRWPAALAVGALAVAGLALDRSGRRDLALVALVIGLSLLPQAILLASRPPTTVQDSVALVDAAARRLAAGQNPYGHDYATDPALASFWVPEWPVNPLLSHLVYPPGAVLLGLAAHAVGLSVQWLWLPGTIALALAGRWTAGPLGVVATALNPALLLDSFPLLNDLFFLAAALAAVALAERRRPLAAGVAFGVALALKQTAILFLPLLVVLAWRRGGLARTALATAVTGMAFLVPFLAWDAGAVIRDTASYFYGAGVDAFPIRGPGIAGALLQAGLLPNRWTAYPSAAVQAVLLIPVLAAGAVLLQGDSAPRRFAWAAGLAVAVFAGGRTLAPNYVSVASVLVLLAVVSGIEERAPGVSAVGRREHRPVGDAGEEVGA